MSKEKFQMFAHFTYNIVNTQLHQMKDPHFSVGDDFFSRLF